MRKTSTAICLVTAAALGAPAAADCPEQWLPGDRVPGTGGSVHATTTWDPDGPGPRAPVLVAGGSFSVAGDVLANNIACWDGFSWGPLGSGMNGPVSALTVLPNGDLIAGGLFTTAGDVSANNIARWDGSSWAPLGTGIRIENAEDWGGVWALTVLTNGDLIVGGHFTTAGEASVNNIASAHWDGSTWVPLGSGLGPELYAPVYGLTVLPNGDLIVGGYFTTAGGRVSAYWARWGRPYHDLDSDGAVGLDDFRLVESCLGGPGTAYGAGCDCAGSDDDGDVDLADFSAFQTLFAGSPSRYIRVVRSGDAWVYSDRRDGTINGEPVSVVGTNTGNVLDDTHKVTDLAANTARVICNVFSGMLNDKTPVSVSSRSYFSQDDDGTWYVHGGADDCTELSSERFIQMPPEGKVRILASPITIGATNEWEITYDDGMTDVGVNTVVGVERINVPAGEFTAWIIEWEGTVTIGTGTESYWMTSWFVPMLGANVRLEVDLIYIDVGTTVRARHVRELTETNVPH